VWWIRQSILQALAEQARIIRLPLNRIGALSKINKAAIALEQKFEREPSTRELAALLDLSTDAVEDFMKAASRHVSIDAPVTGEEDTSLLSLLQNIDEPDPDHALLRESLQDEIYNTLIILSEKERAVLSYFFGINGHKELSLQEISDKLDLTRERVRQIKEKAIKKLKNSSRTKALKIYLG
jgi:RNA polymerase primary sigma factor